jgi:hypothetical protein
MVFGTRITQTSVLGKNGPRTGGDPDWWQISTGKLAQSWLNFCLQANALIEHRLSDGFTSGSSNPR